MYKHMRDLIYSSKCSPHVR